VTACGDVFRLKVNVSDPLESTFRASSPKVVAADAVNVPAPSTPPKAGTATTVGSVLTWPWLAASVAPLTGAMEGIAQTDKEPCAKSIPA